MVRIGANVDREPASSARVYIVVQINAARNAFRAATTIPNTRLQFNQICSGPTPCDSFDLGFMFPYRFYYGTISLLYFSARRRCDMKFDIPGRDEGTSKDRR